MEQRSEPITPQAMKNNQDHETSDKRKNLQLIEKYQAIYQKNPQSKVFAPLSEAYRKVGKLESALKISQAGVKRHPNFVGGRIALSRLLMESHHTKAALSHLEKVVQLAPENLLAHNLMAQTHLQLKQPKEALKAFKIVLFFNPQSTKAQKAIRKLESLTADEYDDDLFEMMPLSSPPLSLRRKSDRVKTQTPSINYYLSLSDAYIIRNDELRAMKVMQTAKTHFPEAPEILRRLEILQLSHEESQDGPLEAQNQNLEKSPTPDQRTSVSPQQELHHIQHIEKLKRWLTQIKERQYEI